MRWLFVTGTPRSGTTFTGLILSTPLSVDYIHEPFNPDCGLPGIEQEYVYTRSGLANEPDLRAKVAAMKSYRFHLRTGYYRRDSRWRRAIKRVLGGRGPFYLRLAKMNVFRRSVVVKDPKGCLLTGWLGRDCGFRPVVIVRHPAAYVASQLRLGPDMRSELAALAAQPDLVADHFEGDASPLRPASDDPVVLASTLWSALTRVILAQAASVPSAIVVRHEDLSGEPERHFQALFHSCGLPWTARTARRVRRLTTGQVEARGGRTQDFHRDSARLFEHRLKTLTPEQRRQVYDLTSDVAAAHYSRDSFAL